MGFFLGVFFGGAVFGFGRGALGIRDLTEAAIHRDRNLRNRDVAKVIAICEECALQRQATDSALVSRHCQTVRSRPRLPRMRHVIKYKEQWMTG